MRLGRSAASTGGHNFQYHWDAGWCFGVDSKVEFVRQKIKDTDCGMRSIFN